MFWDKENFHFSFFLKNHGNRRKKLFLFNFNFYKTLNLNFLSLHINGSSFIMSLIMSFRIVLIKNLQLFLSNKINQSDLLVSSYSRKHSNSTETSFNFFLLRQNYYFFLPLSIEWKWNFKSIKLSECRKKELTDLKLLE